MIDSSTINQIKNISAEERIKIIEIILESLKHDVKEKSKVGKLKYKQFNVRKFNLGQEIFVDREEIYSERELL